MLGMLSMLRPLLAGVAATFRRLSLQLLQLHKGVAKLGYIVTSLLSGVMQEGYCTASEAEDTEAGMSHQFELAHLDPCHPVMRCVQVWISKALHTSTVAPIHQHLESWV